MNKSKWGLNSFQLKWIAIITMLIDHTGVILFPGEMWFRYVGRIAFPIFCFLLVEGFFHTRDVRRYMTRLGVFALVSEIPYDWALFGYPILFQVQNVFFTLFLGVFLMYLLEQNKNRVAQFIEILLVMWAAGFLNSDYSYSGILLIVIFYYLHEKRAAGLALGAVWNGLPFFQSVQWWGALAMPILWLYNGERGPKMKYFFYIFYPAHLLLLYFIYVYFMGGTAIFEY